jgi:hypothetical protein
MKMACLTPLVAMLLFIARIVTAQSVPALINYQGQVQNPNGTTPPTADYELSFRIYDAAQGGLLIWGPQVFDGTTGPGKGPKIPMVQGYFNVMLGQVDTASRSILTAFGNATRFLEVQVGTNSPVAPRQQLLSAPYAARAAAADFADNAGKLAGFDWGHLLNTNNPVSGKIFGGKIANGTVSTDQLGDSAVTSGKIAPQSVTSGQIAQRTITSALIASNTITSNEIALTSLTLSLLAKEVSDRLVPAGTIVAFGGQPEQIPDGWLLCDGSALDAHNLKYSWLFDAIRQSWGNGAASSAGAIFPAVNSGPNQTDFNIPDLRGLFLRGVNGNRNDSYADPDTALRINLFNGGSISNLAGSFQADEFKGHSHPYEDHQVAGGSSPQVSAGGGYDRRQTPRTTGIVGGLETRPKNAYVNYIVKY